MSTAVVSGASTRASAPGWRPLPAPAKELLWSACRTKVAASWLVRRLNLSLERCPLPSI